MVLSVTDSIAAAMEGRVRLLVFDNCEHVLDAAADLIEAIFAHSATVQILATSREGLGALDEQVWPVPSLDVGAGIDSAAVTLFVERARSAAPRFSLAKADEASAVVEICRRLDGIPLAIELAASRMASMTASEVRDRLDQRFRLLVGARRGLERHHTLRHAVAWSYDLLDDTEKKLLERCFGVRRWVRPAKRLRRSGIPGRPRRLRHPGSARCPGAQVAAGRRPVFGAHPVFDAGDDPPVRRGTTRRSWRGP
jgi:predicted ATPase